MDDEEFEAKLLALRAREGRGLKPYDETDDADSSVEHRYLGAVRVRLPRRTRVLVGYALIVFILCASAAVVIAALRV